MEKDVVRAIGYATLGSRLKRLGEKLQAQTHDLAADIGQAELPAAHNPVLATLDWLGPLPVVDLAKTLGQSQPGVTRMVNKMKQAGLVVALPDTRDKRVSKIALTEKGALLVAQLKSLMWPLTHQSVADACSDLSGSFLDQLGQLEDALDSQPLRTRTSDPAPDWHYPGAADASPQNSIAMTPGTFAKVVWQSLTGNQAHLSVGDNLARRFDPAISPFAATRDSSPEALAALTRLIGPGDDRAYVAQVAKIVLPEGLEAEIEALAVLMTQATPQRAENSKAEIVRLGPSDHAQMLDLAALTNPGPFKLRTPELGPFWGIHQDGRLIAMAGTRLNFGTFREISGICVHPDFRGRGLATDLTLYAASKIRDRGEIPFLHSWKDNRGAIALYKKLGFEILCDINVAIVKKRQI